MTTLDYYVYAQQAEYPYDHFERHAGLTPAEAARLREALSKREDLEQAVVEPSLPEWYTVGYDATLWAIEEELGRRHA
jgi:hypothetical protein